MAQDELTLKDITELYASMSSHYEACYGNENMTLMAVRQPVRIVSEGIEHHLRRKATWHATAVVKHIHWELDKKVEYEIHPVQKPSAISLSLQDSVLRSLTVSANGDIIYGSNLA